MNLFMILRVRICDLHSYANIVNMPYISLCKFSLGSRMQRARAPGHVLSPYIIINTGICSAKCLSQCSVKMSGRKACSASKRSNGRKQYSISFGENNENVKKDYNRMRALQKELDLRNPELLEILLLELQR